LGGEINRRGLQTLGKPRRRKKLTETRVDSMAGGDEERRGGFRRTI